MGKLPKINPTQKPPTGNLSTKITAVATAIGTIVLFLGLLIDYQTKIEDPSVLKKSTEHKEKQASNILKNELPRSKQRGIKIKTELLQTSQGAGY